LSRLNDLRAMITPKHITALSLEFMRATGTKEVTLSYWIFLDSKKLKSLREDADITIGRYNSALNWFDENWPPNATWPAGVERPAVASSRVA
jgi:hypothetical protein